MPTDSHPAVEQHHDPTGARIAMWLFLFTELLLFGGLFLLYAVYRSQFPDDFHFAAGNLDSLMGAANTLVLLTSSLTMALAVGAVARGRTRLAAGLLGTTIAAGALFLVVKYFEWSEKFHHGLYPNSEELLRHTPGENMFYGLYYAMTGLHGIHVIIGMIILGIMFFMVAGKNAVADSRMVTRVENSGLYWHLVDVVWIFLFPLFYLIS